MHSSDLKKLAPNIIRTQHAEFLGLVSGVASQYINISEIELPLWFTLICNVTTLRNLTVWRTSKKIETYSHES